MLLRCLCGTQTQPDLLVPVSTVCVNVPSFAPGLLRSVTRPTDALMVLSGWEKCQQNPFHQNLLIHWDQNVCQGCFRIDQSW